MASPLYCSSYLLLPWFIVALGHKSSHYSQFNLYCRHRVGTRNHAERARHGHELKLAVADPS